MRLSDEDDNLAAHEESNSISHQRKLMLDHIQKLPELKDCNIMEFSDDGYSGADFSRPNLVKMMDLVKAGKIQVIVTKDYSRLGRDYLEVGKMCIRDRCFWYKNSKLVHITLLKSYLLT